MLKLNLKMNDGTELKEVIVFRSKEMGDSAIRSKGLFKVFLEMEEHKYKTLWFSGKFVQGWLIPVNISEYEFIEDTEEVKENIQKIIDKNSGLYDSNDTLEFVINHREELLRILK